MLTEDMLRVMAREVLSTTLVTYQNETYDFGNPFQRLTVKQSILRFTPGYQRGSAR